MKILSIKISIALIILFSPITVYAGIDQNINDFLAPISKLISSIVFYSLPLGTANVELIVIWLIAGGIFSTIYFKFINFTGFGHAIHILEP